MFEVKQYGSGRSWYIGDSKCNYMHRDGEVLSTREYWPTEEQAQAVLDKFQPKHVWLHGDVFKVSKTWGSIMMYVCPRGEEPRVVYLNYDMVTTCRVSAYLDEATFLFNIADKIKEIS